MLFRQLKENGVAIWPHTKSGGTQSLHETLYRGQCRCNHGASGQCLSILPKSLSLRIPPSNMTAPVSRSMTESGLRSQLTGTLPITHSYPFIRIQVLIPNLLLRDLFPGFYQQFRELNKAIGASGDGHLEYIYDNLMITEVPIFLFRDDFSVERCSPGKCKTQGGWHLCQHQHKMPQRRKGDVEPPCQCSPWSRNSKR